MNSTLSFWDVNKEGEMTAKEGHHIYNFKKLGQKIRHSATKWSFLLSSKTD